jgi:hypothetical protein
VTPPRNRAPTKNDTLSFAVRPIDVGRVGFDMFLADPPTSEAHVYLLFRHIETSYDVSINYSSRTGSPLTYGALFEEARSAETTVWLLEKDSGKGDPRKGVPVSDVTLDEVISQYTKTHRGSFLLDLEASLLQLGVIVPTEGEWKTMRQVLAEEEVEMSLMDPGEHAALMEKLLAWG